MKVKAIINFNDLKENTHRNIGDIFECDEERKQYLLEHNAIEVIEEVKEVKETKPKTTKKKSTKKSSKK